MAAVVQIPLTADSEITAFGRDLGTGTAFPTVGPTNSALRRGDAYYHSTYGALFLWSGTAWRARGPGELTSTQRAALVTANIPYAGFEVFETDTTLMWYWTGTLWSQLGAGQWVIPIGAQGGTGYSFPLPVGSWGDLPGMGFTGLVVPAGRSLEVELQVPYLALGSGSGARLRFVSGAAYNAIQGEQRFGTSGGVSSYVPVFMRAYYTGDGTAQQVKVHGYCEAVSAVVTGYDANGPTLRYRIS